jgi:CO dehydrogenase maturation factor
MKLSIAVAGKGGTGKTTVAALIIGYLKNKSNGSILAVDADPTANLGEAIGLIADTTIGATLAKFREELSSLPQGVSKNEYLESKLDEILVEGKKVDLLVMGRKEGAGCYCYPNQILRQYIDTLSKNYSYLIIDNEAGMEHLSRRITRELDFLFLVSDPTVRGVKTAGALRDLAEELELNIKKTCLVIDNLSGELHPLVLEEIRKQRLELIQTIPGDPIIVDYNLSGKPLTDLPETSVATKAISELIKQIMAGDW